MKRIAVIVSFFVCGFSDFAESQQNIQFIYVGSKPYSPQGVFLTSADFQGDYLKIQDSQLTKIYYTNQTILDSLKAYISRSKWVKHAATLKKGNNFPDTIDAFKILGVDVNPLLVQGRDCAELCSSAMTYLTNMGWVNTSGWSALNNLMFQCHETPFHRDEFMKKVTNLRTHSAL